jgi:hypothetical protein
MTAENQLHIPRKDFTADRSKQRLNASEIERWAAGPKDFIRLRDHGVLPDADDYRDGAIIRVGAALHLHDSGAWVAL